MKQINKKQARRLFNKGVTISLKPSKVCEQAMEHSQWFHWFRFNNEESDDSFDSIVNSYEYYNCNYKEIGLRAHFYIYSLDYEEHIL